MFLAPQGPKRVDTAHSYKEVIAAVTTLPTVAKSWLNSFGSGHTKTDALERIRKYDNEGPGFVGFYLDLKADVTSLLDFKIQEWNPTTQRWEWSTNSAVTTVLASRLVGVNGERLAEIVRQISREFEIAGQVGFAPVSTPDGVRYKVLPLDPDSYEVLGNKKDPDPQLAFRGSPSAKSPREGADDWLILRRSAVHRLYRPHPKWWAEPYTPLARSLKDIRRFDNSGRALHRAIASQLLNSKIVWFKGNARDLVDGHNPKVRGFLGEQLQSIIEASSRSIMDFEESDPRSAMFHPIVSEEPPQPIDTGQVVDPSLIEVKDDALEDFARSVNVPMSVLVEGQGAAARQLNEWLQDKAFKETAIMPDAERVASGLTVAFLHPQLRQIEGLLGGKAVSSFRIWPDEASITQDEPEIADIFESVREGILKPSAVVEALEAWDHALELPEGLTDYDRWRATQNVTGSAKIESRWRDPWM